jgi:hypothetical protein
MVEKFAVLQNGWIVPDEGILHPGHILLLLPRTAYKLTPISQYTPDFMRFSFWLSESEMNEIETIVPAHESTQSNVKRTGTECKVVGIHVGDRDIL